MLVLCLSLSVQLHVCVYMLLLYYMLENDIIGRSIWLIERDELFNDTTVQASEMCLVNFSIVPETVFTRQNRASVVLLSSAGHDILLPAIIHRSQHCIRTQ